MSPLLIASNNALPARSKSDNHRHNLGEVLFSLGYWNRKIVWKTRIALRKNGIDRHQDKRRPVGSAFRNSQAVLWAGSLAGDHCE